MKLALELRPGRSLRLPTMRPLLLQVMRGRIWLTRHNDRLDHFIGAGRAVALADHDRETIVEAQGEAAATVLLSLSDGDTPLVRLRRWLQRRWQPRWPSELLQLEERALQDIGALPELVDTVRRRQALRSLQETQARLMHPR